MDKLTFDNLTVARTAWSFLLERKPHGARKDGDDASFLTFCTDDLVVQFSFPENTPLYGGTTVYSPRRTDASNRIEFNGQDAYKRLCRMEQEHLVTGGLNGSPEFIATGNRVVMLGEAGYTIKKSGVVIANHMFAVVMDFRDGLICRLRVYEDGSDIIAAYAG